MNIALWIAQGLLALMYLVVGALKATRPIDQLSKSMTWVADSPVGFVRFIGVAELLGSIGLILPMLTGILPWLTVAAAIGLVILQVSAAVLHFSRGEGNKVPTNAVLLLVALFVLIGRVALVPVA